jgi:hypothetical protein
MLITDAGTDQAYLTLIDGLRLAGGRMVDEQQPEQVNDEEFEADDQTAGEGPERLTQAVRRERLAQLRAKIGDHAQQDGDVIVVEPGEPVVLHVELDRDGVYTLTWWATALTDHGHHRWRDAAANLLRDGESIHTSALGGGFLIEIWQTTRDEATAVQLAADSSRVERVRELVSSFPEAVAALPDEPVPDYLLPPEPELPPLGEVEADDAQIADETGSGETSGD